MVEGLPRKRVRRIHRACCQRRPLSAIYLSSDTQLLEQVSELKARFGKALIWSAAGEWGRQLMAFFVFGVIARVVTPAAFGLVALDAFIVLGQVLIEQGLPDAIVQRREIEKDTHLDTAFWLTLLMGSSRRAGPHRSTCACRDFQTTRPGPGPFMDVACPPSSGTRKHSACHSSQRQ